MTALASTQAGVSQHPAPGHSARTALREVPRSDRIVLHTLDDIKKYFAERTHRTFFVSPTNFNMLGMHDWVRGWHNITLLDCFDSQHDHCLTVPDDHTRLFDGVEDVNHYLLDQPAVRKLIVEGERSEVKDQALFLFFDEALERKCADLGLEVALPPNALVREMDSKIVATELGNTAGVHSVPHVLAPVGSYAALQSLAMDHGLGDRWVVQTAYGDSGKTTFFIGSETDYQAVAHKVECEKTVKVMRWIRCKCAAVEACATRWGTFVGPLLTELIGQPELTPYAGGWCGNENYASAFTPTVRTDVQRMTRAMGDALYARGYRGTFELDYLLDLDTQEIYLGELNARITGVTAITNTSDFSEAMLPLFLFHLLEFDSRVDLLLDVCQFNHGLLTLGARGLSSQVILKHTNDALQVITHAPQSGVYRINDDGVLTLKHAGVRRRDALTPNEAYVLRIQQAGEYAYRGSDMAIMFLNGVIREDDGALNHAGKRWVQALKSTFETRPLTQEERATVAFANNPANVKSARA